MVEKKAPKESKKVKKKQWFEITAPKLFSSVKIGETLAYTADLLKDKTLDISVADLTGDMKRQNIKVNFKVTGLEGAKASTEVIGYSISVAHLRKFVRSGTRKIEDSFMSKSKDGVNIRVKTLYLTKKIVQRGILTKIRGEGRAFVNEEFGKLKFEEIIKNAVDYKFQIGLKKKLKKIYPLGSCEFKSLKKL